MDNRSCALVRDIRSKILDMLEERNYLDKGIEVMAAPSKYWSDTCSFFDYLLYLPEEFFSKLRLHTYHITGDNYQTYHFNVGKTNFESA